MKVLIVGFGSIGRRHFQSFKRVRPELDIALLRRKDSLAAPGFEQVQAFYDLPSAAKYQPDLVCICTPSQSHLADLNALLPLAPNIFVEKPLITTLEDAKAVEALFERSSSKFFYGCVMRFHPLLFRLRQIVVDRTYGKALTYRIECGSYLPDWRPMQDYRKLYSAEAASGGVALDLIHEFDYAQWCFGEIQALTGLRSRVSSLEINSEDLCVATATHKTGTSGGISLNYFQPVPSRSCTAIFENAVVETNLLTGNLCIREKSASEKNENHFIEREAMFDLQSRELFETIESNLPSKWNVASAVTLVKDVLSIKII